MPAAAEHGHKSRHHRNYSAFDAGSKQVQLHPVTLYYIGDDADELEAGIRATRFRNAESMMVYVSLLLIGFLALYFTSNVEAAQQAFGITIVAGLGSMALVPLMFSLLKLEADPLRLHFSFFCAGTSALTLALAAHMFHLSPPSTTTDLDAYESLAANAAMVMLGNALLSYYLHAPFHVKLLGGYAIPLAHTFRPIHGLGAAEARLMWMGSLFGQVCGYFLERAQRTVYFEQQMQLRIAAANRKADSRLNHVVKGLCGGANGLLESLQVVLKLGGTELAGNSDRLLTQVREMLADASDWCHKRQIFVSLEARTYDSNQVDCALCNVLNRLVGADGLVESVSAARVDVSVLILSVQEALSNARKYRSPASNVRVKAELVDDQTLHVTIDSLNQKGLNRMTDEECKRAFAAGSKLSGSTYMSDGIGLDSVAAAVAAASGHAWLSTSSEPDGDHTIFHVTLPAEACPTPTPTASCSASETSETSRGHRMDLDVSHSAMEDLEDDVTGEELTAADVAVCAQSADAHSGDNTSTVRQRHGGGTRGSSVGCCCCSSSSSSSVGGGVGGDAEGSGDAGHMGATGGARGASGSHRSASGGSGSGANDGARGLRCFGVDDCHFLRAMHLVMFETFMGADMAVSTSVGATLEEAMSFVDIALGKLDATTFKPRPPPHVHADVVVIDQNMNFTSEAGESQTCLGSDLAARLDEGGFTGVACILSGSTREELESLVALPGVDMAYDKSASLNVIGSRIRAKLEEKRR